MIEKTLVILKPCTVQRALSGEILHRCERKGLWFAGRLRQGYRRQWIYCG